MAFFVSVGHKMTEWIVYIICKTKKSPPKQEKKMKKTAILFAALSLFALSAENKPSENLQSFLKNCIEFEGDPWDKKMEGSSFNWEFEAKYKVVYANDKYFSYVADEFSYTGGAHGCRQVSVGSILRSNKRRVKLADIAPDAAKRARLLEKVNAELIKRFKCKNRAELAKRLLNAAYLTENFYLKGKNIHFVFNEYDIACKADGPIEIAVPLN